MGAAVPAQYSPPSTSPLSTRLLEGVADELLPVHLWPDPRMRFLVSGWLAGFRSPRTRRAYAGDLLAWQQWCRTHSVDPLRARRVQADLYLAGLLEGGAAPTSAGRRLSALSSFCRFLIEQDDLDVVLTNPAAAVRRPTVDAQHSPTLGLTRAEATAVLEAADRARGPQRLRNAAILRMLLHNALRLDELLGADLADLGRHPGRASVHDTLTIRRKGGRRARIALAPATVDALQRYLQERARRDDVAPHDLTGSVFASRRGRRLTPKTIWELVRRPPVTPRSRPGPSSRPTRCGIPRSPSLWMPERRCATSRTSPGTATPAPPAATTAPAKISTAPPPTPSPAGSRRPRSDYDGTKDLTRDAPHYRPGRRRPRSRSQQRGQVTHHPAGSRPLLGRGLERAGRRTTVTSRVPYSVGTTSYDGQPVSGPGAALTSL